MHHGCLANRLEWLRVLTIIAFQSLTCATVLADGKMYAERVNTEIPYQRALILFADGKQTLVLQSQYQIPGEPGNHKLGWVVPVPAVPIIHSMDADMASWLFNDLDLRTKPKMIRISHGFAWVALGMFLVSGAVLVITFFLPGSIMRSRILRIASACVVISILCLPLLVVGVRSWKGIDGVEVVRAGQVGIFDTKVIRAESASALLDWFKLHSFRFDAGDEKAIQSYIDRGWCFVTATVDATISPNDADAVSNGLLAPLILDFATPQPVYPTALTATGGHPTEILIYVAATQPMKTSSDLVMKFSGEIDNFIPHRLMHVNSDPDFEWLDEMAIRLPKQIHVTKFKATLTSTQMAEDIVFLPDPNPAPYRERIYRW